MSESLGDRGTQLSAEQLQRYARHISLPEFGISAQRSLRESSVLLIGAGGLGSPAALYLAAAGIGRLGIVDDDEVELTNLQRQVLHGTATLGHPKVESASERLADLNPDVEIEQHRVRLNSANARALIADYDLVIDGSDNFPTRYLVNDCCVLEQVPFVYGSIYRFEGQLSLFATPDGPCYRCLFSEPPAPELVPSCEEAGVLGVLPGVVGTMQALEAIKFLTGIGTPTAGRLILFDALGLAFREIELRRDPACLVCGEEPAITAPIDYEQFCGISSNSERGEIEIGAEALAGLIASDQPPLILDVREEWEFEIARISGSRLLPLSQLMAAIDTIPTNRAVVTVCHHGLRSLTAANFLREAGIPRVVSLAGGVDNWATSVDPDMRRY